MASASPLVQSIGAAIVKMENVPNAALNNPFALMDLPYYQQTGQFRLASYPTYDAGVQAGYNQVQRYVDRGYDLNTFFATYAPAGHGNNDPANYAAFVSQQTGIPLGTPLNTLSDGGSLQQYAGGGTTSQQAAAGDPSDDSPDGLGSSLLSSIDFSNPLVLAGVAAGLLVLGTLARRS